MSIFIKPPLPRYPTRWSDFDQLMPSSSLEAFGFRVELAEINRWAARYRAAASFDGIKLVEYQTSDTVNGYAALIRVTLVWSAFERYLPIIGSKQEKCEALFHSHDPQALVNKVLALDKDNRLFTYIKERVTNQTLARNLDLYGKGTLSNVSYLLSAIRHIFGHGHLTPVSNDADANTTVSLCDLLSDFHMKGMDDDFSKRVTNVMEETEATQEYYSAR